VKSQAKESEEKMSAGQQACAGWVSIDGIVSRCSELVRANRNNSRKYHSTKCQRTTERLRAKGLSIGDLIPPQPRRCEGWVIRDGFIAICGELFTPKRRATAKAHGECAKRKVDFSRRGIGIGDPHRRKPESKPVQAKPCKGWVIRNGFIAECGESFIRNRCTASGHYECVARKHYLTSRHVSLGDPYNPNRIAKRQEAKPCKGWVIRDGFIAECGESFTPTKIGDLYHLRLCGGRKTYWQTLGYCLRDSVRRKCAYRRCTNPPFDRIKRNTRGDYYCPGTSHGTLEKLARKADTIAANKAELECLQVCPKGGRVASSAFPRLQLGRLLH
jgi:hypothetical protein